MITQEQAEAANDYIRDHAKEYAQAKADRIQLEHFRKSQEAILAAKGAGTVQARQAYAFDHPDYRQILEALRDAVEREEFTRYRIKAAELKIEIWRTQEANNRRGV